MVMNLIFLSENILIAAVIFLSGCETGLIEEKNNGAGLITDTVVENKISGISDTTVNFVLKNDTAYFSKGNKLLVKSFIQPEKITGGDSINPKTISDEAFVIANCLIILRNIKTAGHFCHIPEVESVEIYISAGSKKEIKRGVTKSSVLTGSDFLSNFLGNRFSSPSGKWGLISVEAEGSLYGYLVVKSNGTLIEVAVNEEIYMNEESLKPVFNENDEMVWKALSGNNNSVTFLINSEGEYKFMKD